LIILQNKPKSVSIYQKVIKKRELPISFAKAKAMNLRTILIHLTLTTISSPSFAQGNIHSDTLLVSGTDSANEKIFGKVEIEATFPGGNTGWRKFLELNLRSDIPVNKGAPAGIYTVWIQFVVDKHGVISDIKPLTSWGFGMEEEVVRVIRKAPNWEPAIQNGKPVKAYRKQPVAFQIDDANLQVVPGNSSVLYIGIDNPITVNCPKAKDKNLHVTISQGSIKGENGNYIVQVTGVGRATIHVYNKNKEVGSYSLEVANLPATRK
jgi:hypothetical protein